MTYLLELARDDSYTYDVGSLRALHRMMTTAYRAKLVARGLLNRPGHHDPRPGLWRRGHIAVTLRRSKREPEPRAVPKQPSKREDVRGTKRKPPIDDEELGWP